MSYRDHQPVIIDQFNGLWQRGDTDNTPMDHFSECENLKFVGSNAFKPRDGIGISQTVSVPLANVRRIYNYPTMTGRTLIVLTLDEITNIGNIYHVINATTVYGPILSIQDMTDFAFVPYAGRAYISPFNSQHSRFPSPSLVLTTDLIEGSVGNIEDGIHKYAYSYVTATGETKPSPLTSVDVTAVPLADPLVSPVITVGIGSNKLVVGATYKWLFTYALSDGRETAIGPEVTYVNTSSTNGLLGYTSAAFPAEVILINIYRTLAGGSIFYKLTSTHPSSISVISGPNGFLPDWKTDLELVLQPLAPIANNTMAGQVQLSGMLNSIGIISKNIYRTEADLDQLKLLTNISDTDTQFLDNLSDSALGVNAPILNTTAAIGISVEKGLENEFLYVYAGDGTAARKAAGNPMSGNMTIAHGAAGNTDAGIRVFAFVRESISGALSAPGMNESFTTVASSSVSFGNVQATGSPLIAKRHLVATKVIPNFNGNVNGYQFFFVPNATINNDTDLFLNNISFFDADLLDDASHLIDNYGEIPAGAVLTMYHNRLVLCTTYTDISVGLVSAVGEPEAISMIDGLFAFPPDGNPITNAQELRDILYVTKRSRTVSYTDNGDVPSSWPLITVDNALGTFVHGIATVLDSGSSSVDYLIICTYQGITLFNGRYITPELSWKIEDYWRALDRDDFRLIQIVNAPIQKEIYTVLPDGKLLVGNYGNGMDPKKIRWSPWTCLPGFNTIAIYNIDEIVIGANAI